jgi:hypothetical protein
MGEITYETPGSIHISDRKAASRLDQPGYTKISGLCESACDRSNKI